MSDRNRRHQVVRNIGRGEAGLAVVLTALYAGLLFGGITRAWGLLIIPLVIATVALPMSGWLRSRKPWRLSKNAFGVLVVGLAAYGIAVRPHGPGWAATFGAVSITSLVLHAAAWREKRKVSRSGSRPEPTRPHLELKAPHPRPGQCPVCSLGDLDERAVGDELLGDAGTALARVVAYGPDRAHAECAAVVPYVAPERSTSGGMRRAHPGFWIDGKYVSCGCDLCEGTQACAAVPLSDGRRMCLAHNEGDPRCTVYPPAGPKRGRLRESFVNAMGEEAVALGEKLQRELGQG